MMKKLAVLDPKAAFVDVGSEHMHVSVAGGPPAVFGTVTAQLHALRDWLLGQHVRSVAMEATGVYWLPLYGVLEAAGLQVSMVNGRQTRNLPGRKTDRVDCQWGATLHRHGLMRAGFVPPADIRRLQDYLRLRADHVAAAAGCVQLMQKALERMNIKLHDVIASLAGASGLAVVRAIVAGERSPRPGSRVAMDRSAATRPNGSSNRCTALGPTSLSSRCAKYCAPGSTTSSKSPIATARSRQCCRRSIRRRRRSPRLPSARASMPPRSPRCEKSWRRGAVGVT